MPRFSSVFCSLINASVVLIPNFCHACNFERCGYDVPVNTAFILGDGRFQLLPGRRRTQRTDYVRQSELLSHRNDNDDHPVQNRRACLESLTLEACAILVNSQAASAKIGYHYSESKVSNLPSTSSSRPDTNDEIPSVNITLPLEPASGGTFCVRLTVFASSDGSTSSTGESLGDPLRVYRAIVDSGSPYLVLPYSGPKQSKKINKINALFASNPKADDAVLLSSSNYAPTEEIYGAVKGQIDWKLARYIFRDPRLQTIPNGNENHMEEAVVGVLDDALTNEATGGGMVEPYALLGLIRNSNMNADRRRFPQPRPTFLEQEAISAESGEYQIKSFSINGPLRELTLSTQSLIPATAPAMSLVDLRTYGDFVEHYSVFAESVSVNGITVTSQRLKEFTGSNIERPIIAVFDTGLTGCLLTKPFWNEVVNFVRAESDRVDSDDAKPHAEFRSVSLSVKATQKQQKNSNSLLQTIKSTEEDGRFYVQPIDLDWFDDEQNSPHVIVLGQTFLSKGALTIDIDKRIATFI
ncbi:hypothetical protein ACHAWF_009508 [Thalassiosira exigua]